MSKMAIGQIKKRPNKNKKWNEKAEYIVLYGMLDGKKVKLAFTEAELRRPLARAARNPEDFPGTHWVKEVEQLLK